MRLLELLERRAAVLELVSDALEPRRPVVHVGPERRRRPGPRRLARRRDVRDPEQGARRRRARRPGPHGLREGDSHGPRGGVRALAVRRGRLRGDLGFVPMATTERDYYEVLGVPRGATDAEIKRAFRYARARASSRRLERAGRRAPVPGGRRGVRGPLGLASDARSTTAIGHAGLRRGGFQPHFTDFGSLADVFAAFFGEDLLRRAAARRAPGRAAGTSRRSSRSTRRGVHGASRPRSPLDVAVAVRALRRERRGAGHGQRALRDVRRRGRRRQRVPEHLRRVRPAAHLPDVRRVGRGAREAVQRVRRRGSARRRGEQLEVDVPAGIDDGQRIRLRGEGHAGFRGGERGNAFVVVRVRPDPRFVRDGDDLHTAVALTDDRRGARDDASGAGDRRRRRARGPAGHAARRGARAARAGDAVAARLAARRSLRAARRRRSDDSSRDEQRTLLEEFERSSRTTRHYARATTTRASSAA